MHIVCPVIIMKFSDNLIRTFQGVTNALIHVRSESMKKVLNTIETHWCNMGVLGCSYACCYCMHVHGYHNVLSGTKSLQKPGSAIHISVSVLDHLLYSHNALKRCYIRLVHQLTGKIKVVQLECMSYYILQIGMWSLVPGCNEDL